MLKFLLAFTVLMTGSLPLPVVAQTYDERYQGGGYPGGGYPGGSGGGYPGGGYPGGGGNRPAQQIRCESWDYQPARCPANTRGGVRLLQSIKGDCQQGRTWGWDRGGVWVRGGCRAVFLVGGYGGGPGGPGPGPGPGGPRVISCASWNYQPARCAADVYRGAELVENTSSTCNRRNWGWDRGGVWVNGGCRGRFRVY